MEAKIADALEAQRVVVSDVYGDGRHVAIDVVSAAFDGKTSVQRQRMVYKVGRRGHGRARTRGASLHCAATVCRCSPPALPGAAAALAAPL